METAVCKLPYDTMVQRFIEYMENYKPEEIESITTFLTSYFGSGETPIPIIKTSSEGVDETIILNKGVSGKIVEKTLKDGRTCVVKILTATPDVAFLEALVQYFLHLVNPYNVNPCYGVERQPSSTSAADSTYYIPMGKLNFTLSEHLSKLNPTETEHDGELFKRIVMPIYVALLKLYECGLVYHGDLHDGNIMYLEGEFPNVPKIIDFGRCMLDADGTIINMSENVQAKYDIVTLLASLKYTYFDNAWLTEMLGYLSHYLVNKEGVFNWTAGYYKELPQEEVKGVYNRLNDELKTYSLDYGAAPSTGEDYVPFKEDDVKATKDLPSFTSIENLTAGLDAWATGELLAGEEGPAVPRSHVPLSYGTGSAAASSGSAAANHEGEIMANKFLLGGRRRRRRATRRRRRTQRRRRATKVRRRR